MAKKYALTERQHAHFLEMQRRVFGTPIDESRPAESPLPTKESDICVMLLEDLESGQSARSALLVGARPRNLTLLTVYGLKDDDNTFDLEWSPDDETDPETVEEISIFATPAELHERLSEFSFVNPADVVVQLGNHVRMVGDRDPEPIEFNPFRWIVEAKNNLAAAPLINPDTSGGIRQTWMGAEKTILRDTGHTLEVFSLLPVGVDIENKTPMQAGAIALCAWVERTGWTVHAVEARSVTTDFVEIPINPYG